MEVSIWSIMNAPENRHASVIISGQLAARRSTGWSSSWKGSSSTADRGKQPPEHVWTEARVGVIKSSFPDRDLFNHRTHHLPERFEGLGGYRQRSLPVTWEFFQLQVLTSGSGGRKQFSSAKTQERSSASTPLCLPSCSCSAGKLPFGNTIKHLLQKAFPTLSLVPTVSQPMAFWRACHNGAYSFVFNSISPH